MKPLADESKFENLVTHTVGVISRMHSASLAIRALAFVRLQISEGLGRLLKISKKIESRRNRRGQGELR